MSGATMSLNVSGHPLRGTVRINHPRPDTEIHRTGWLLDVQQVAGLLDAWKHAPGGDSDVRREWAYFDLGLFVVVLLIDGEVVMSSWEAATGSNGTDLYSTVSMPFDFTVTEVPDRPPAEWFRRIDTDPNI